MTRQRAFTNSELQTFKQCRRKWWLGWHRGLRLRAQEVAGARSLGTRVHLALAAMYGDGVDPLSAFEADVAADLERLGDDPRSADVVREAGLGRAMIEGYIEWLAETGADQGLRVVGVEQVVDVRLPGSEHRVAGKMDLRVEREVDGARLFLDHKTVGSLAEAQKMLHLDEQMLHYHLLEYLQLLEELGEEAGAAAPRADGALYNMLRKVMRTARATPPFYERVEVRHNVHELRSYWQRVHGEVLEVVALERRLDAGEDHRYAAYPSPSRDCTWKCDFYPVCGMLDDGSDAEGMLAALYEERDPLDRYEDKGGE